LSVSEIRVTGVAGRMTENGFARTMSRAGYQNWVTTTFAIICLPSCWHRTTHAFCPDDISPCDHTLFDPSCILGPNQITDVCLSALAVKDDGRLAGLDRNVPVCAIRGAEPKHLAML
jgi:hypothetical protein